MPFVKSQVTFEKDKQRENAGLYISQKLHEVKELIGSPVYNAELGKSGTSINAFIENGCVFLLTHYPA